MPRSLASYGMEFGNLEETGVQGTEWDSFFEDNNVGFFRRETETVAIRPGSDDVEDFLEKSMGSGRIGGT